MMNKSPKRVAVVLAIILVLSVLNVVPAIAQSLSKAIDVYYRNIRIYVEGDLLVPKVASGRVVEPFIYDGAVYLPIRVVSEALGRTVTWDDATNSVYIGEMTPQDVKEITVSTAEELVAALGSNRRIILEEGVYNLTAVSSMDIINPSIYFAENFDGPELVLDGVHNLTIQGAGDGWSEILADPRYAVVMYFLNCSNINIANVKAGHTEGGYCSGGVFSFESSSGIRIDDTLMYGCGTVGLSIMQVIDMKVANSTIYDCTQGIMDIYYSSDISFKNCVFKDNAGFIMVDVQFTNGLTIDSCAFLHNVDEYRFYPMFSILQSENVSIKNNRFEDNILSSLFEQKDIKIDSSNKLKNNSFKVNR